MIMPGAEKGLVMFNRKIGAIMQARRTELGLTQAEVADKVHVGQSQISKLEKGIRAFSLLDGYLICEALQLDFEEVVTTAVSQSDLPPLEIEVAGSRYRLVR